MTPSGELGGNAAWKGVCVPQIYKPRLFAALITATVREQHPRPHRKGAGPEMARGL